MKRTVYLILVCCLSALEATHAQVIRKDYREMTTVELQTYKNALNRLKTTGVIDRYADAHASVFSNVHMTEEFLPWHRWFILHFEKLMQGSGVAGANKISLPYWDWTSDRALNSGLWTAFLGEYNISWGLNRQLGLTPGGSLPTTVAVQDALNIIPFEPFWRFLEEQDHNVAHVWIGGVMNSGRSPLDPVFYLHHSRVDKIWQDWFNLRGGRVVSYADRTMPNFPSGVPNIDPHTITDSRSIKVWYAQNDHVFLVDYNVSGTELYRYNGIIITHRFIQPANTNCTMISDNKIVMEAGFRVANGARFIGRIDPGSFNTTNISLTEVAFENPDEMRSLENEKTEGNNINELVKVFPNPSSGVFQVMMFNEEVFEATPASYTYQVFDPMGNQIASGQKTDIGIFELDISNQPPGFYILKIIFKNGTAFSKRLSLN
jgi:hypothetical protein